MSLSRRYLFATLSVASLITVYYLYSFWSTPEPPSGRTPLNRFLGLMGFAAILGSLFCGSRQKQGIPLQGARYFWHLMLGSLSLWLITLHAHFRFGNVIATLACLFLAAVVISGIPAALIYRKTARMELQRGGRGSPFQSPLHDKPRLQRWLTLHTALAGGLIAFSLIHIVSILYY